jgi:hypothetical protein
MGLAERRIIQNFQTNELPDLQKRVDEAAGHNVPVEVHWDKLAPEGESHLYVASWKSVYFEPLIDALKAVGKDDLGREALKTGLHKVVIENTRGYYYPDEWAKLEGGTLTLDHDPISNAGDVEARTTRLVTVIENGL